MRYDEQPDIRVGPLGLPLRVVDEDTDDEIEGMAGWAALMACEESWGDEYAHARRTEAARRATEPMKVCVPHWARGTFDARFPPAPPGWLESRRSVSDGGI
jgi:hypothetical protein